MNEKRNDQPIEEIRDLRRHISARFDYDPARLVRTTQNGRNNAAAG